MVDKKKKKMVITTLVCVLVFIAVGYALLTQAIKVGVEGTLNGVWDVYISDIKLKNSTGRAQELNPAYVSNKVNANFEVDLYMPGDSVEYEVTVKNDGSVTKVKMENTPKDKPIVVISKQDATTGEELEGAHLELRDADGNLIEAWVSEKEPHKIVGLAPGKYTLTEILAPEGYELSKETITFVVKEDGTVDGKVIMYNTPETIEVPSTGTFKTITTSLIGLLIIGLGSVIVYKNYKKNEDK